MYKYISCLAAMLIIFSSCDHQLEIVPKGQTTLQKTDDLELLLNQEYSLEVLPFSDLGQICGESIGSTLSIAEMMSTPNTLNYAYLNGDESVDRITLTQSDARYNALYKYINYFNTLLDKIDGAEGSESRKPALKAEARIMRAYFHWLLVGIHAAQYDAASAEELGGIAYVTDIDNTKVKKKLSLAETYRMILADCSDEIIEALPENADDVSRPGSAFGYAVRAKVLMQMKRYADAVPYFEKSLEINSTVDDRVAIRQTKKWSSLRTDAKNLVYVGYGPLINPTTEMITKETDAKFEKNDYVYKYCNPEGSGWDLGYGKMYAGLDGFRMYMGWETQENPYGVTSVRNYLALAECYIRTGQVRKGLELVDKIRKAHVESPLPYTRIYDMGPLTEKAAMRFLQQTKWIECIGSYENFFDMKRWNSEEGYRTTISKDLGEYGKKTLAPDSKLWILPFPANATRYNPTLTQNYSD